MQRRSLGGLALSAVLAPLFAQAQAQAQSPAPGLAAGQIRAKDLIDRDIHSSDNVEIGEVEDLVIDPASGRIAWAAPIARALTGATAGSTHR